jgi:hypothetical protein
MTTRRDFLRDIGLMGLAAICPIGKIEALQNQEKANELKLRTTPAKKTWDVIVVGGGPAGCAAAIASARENASTLLIEANGQLGGMGTAGLVPTWSPFSDGEKIIYRGLAEKIFNESKKGVPFVKPSMQNWVPINAEYLMMVYDRMVSESGAEVLFFSRLCAVNMNGKRIKSIYIANKNGLSELKAKVFIDATGDGDLAAWAGCSYERGYNAEGKNQLSSLCFTIGNVNMESYKSGPRLDTNPPHVSPLFDAVKSGKYPLIDAYANVVIVGPGLLQFNAGHIDVDTTDPGKVSDAMRLGRLKANAYLQALKDLCPKTFDNAVIVKTASVLGIRDSRRITGDYTLTGDDWRARRTFEDEIGRNCYYIDIHGSDKRPQRYKKGESHGIPYRCLTPKGIENLLTAGRCISADREAYGSTRIMPCCLVTGEAAGMAATLAIRGAGDNVHNIDVKNLRQRLRQRGQYFL